MSLQKDITRLVEKPAPEIKLKTAGTPKTLPDTTGLAAVTQPTAGGIASPLTETDYLDRLFYDEKQVTSSDGVFTWVWLPIQAVHFTDANGDPLVMEYQDYVAP